MTEIFRKYERQIVLEDDLLTAPDFLTFMNDLLSQYEQETKIFSVSAFHFAVRTPEGYGYDSVLFPSQQFLGLGYLEKPMGTRGLGRFGLRGISSK